MTPEEQALIDAVCAQPFADAPRLAYAAWLEGQIPPREQGEAIRLAIDTAGKRLPSLPTLDDRAALLRAQRRLHALLETHADAWKAPVLQIAERCELYRGMVASARVDAEVFVKRHDELLSLAPIVHLDLFNVPDHLVQVLKVPALRERIRALTVADQGLTDAHMRQLARTAPLPRLWYLDLIGNRISVDGVESLAVSNALPALTHTVLDANPGNIHERAGVEQALVQAWFPPEGRALEDAYGPVRWLHFHDDCYREYPPNPCGPPLT